MISESKPIYVNIDKYKEIMEIMQVIDKKIVVAKQLLSELEDLKRKEDEEIAKWENSLEEIDHKVENVLSQLGK